MRVLHTTIRVQQQQQGMVGFMGCEYYNVNGCVISSCNEFTLNDVLTDTTVVVVVVVVVAVVVEVYVVVVLVCSSSSDSKQ